MELPHICASCQTLQMVEHDLLRRTQIDRLTWEVGYCCCECKKFQRLYIANRSLMDSMFELAFLKRTHSKFYFRFQKTLHKAMQIQVRFYGPR